MILRQKGLLNLNFFNWALFRVIMSTILRELECEEEVILLCCCIILKLKDMLQKPYCVLFHFCCSCKVQFLLLNSLHKPSRRSPEFMMHSVCMRWRYCSQIFKYAKQTSVWCHQAVSDLAQRPQDDCFISGWIIINSYSSQYYFA